jgi:hypothetical protein
LIFDIYAKRSHASFALPPPITNIGLCRLAHFDLNILCLPSISEHEFNVFQQSSDPKVHDYRIFIEFHLSNDGASITVFVQLKMVLVRSNSIALYLIDRQLAIGAVIQLSPRRSQYRHAPKGYAPPRETTSLSLMLAEPMGYRPARLSSERHFDDRVPSVLDELDLARLLPFINPRPGQAGSLDAFGDGCAGTKVKGNSPATSVGVGRFFY